MTPAATKRRGTGRGRGRARGRRSQGEGQQQARRSQPGGEEESEWSSETSPVDVQPFTEAVRPTITVGGDPVDTFLSLFTPALIDNIVTETNRYAALCLTTTHQGEGPPPTWETDATEIRHTLGSPS